MKIKLVPDVQERTFYTDGSCWPNPGPGGWAVIEHVVEGFDVEFLRAAGGGEAMTSNVKMEGRAIIEAMLLVEGEPVHILSDSLLWINILTTYGPQWRDKSWKKNDGNRPKNLEQVKQALEIYERVGNVRFTHVRGHKGIPGNEAADQYADEMRRQQAQDNVLMEEAAQDHLRFMKSVHREAVGN